MAHAPKYVRSADFSTEEEQNASGRNLVNTAKLDTEVINLGVSVNAVNTNLQKIQRADGRLKDGAVEPHTLNDAVKKLGLAGDATIRGEWSAQVTYKVKDAVSSEGVWYLCHTAHVSGFAFDASKWIALNASNDAVNAALAAAIEAANRALVGSQVAHADRVTTEATSSLGSGSSLLSIDSAYTTTQTTASGAIVTAHLDLDANYSFATAIANLSHIEVDVTFTALTPGGSVLATKVVSNALRPVFNQSSISGHLANLQISRPMIFTVADGTSGFRCRVNAAARFFKTDGTTITGAAGVVTGRVTLGQTSMETKV